MSKNKSIKVEEVATKKSKSKKHEIDGELLVDMQIADEIKEFHDSFLPESSKTQAPITESEATLQEDNVRDLLESELMTRDIGDKTKKFVRSAIRGNKTSKVKSLKGVNYTEYKKDVDTMIKTVTALNFPVSQVAKIVDELIKIKDVDFESLLESVFEFYNGDVVTKENIRPVYVRMLTEAKENGVVDPRTADVVISILNGATKVEGLSKEDSETMIKMTNSLMNTVVENCGNMPIEAMEIMMAASAETMFESMGELMHGPEDIFMMRDIEKLNGGEVTKTIAESEWVKGNGSTLNTVDKVINAIADTEVVSVDEPEVATDELGRVIFNAEYVRNKYRVRLAS